jgi:excisionase family DNA binding protein
VTGGASFPDSSRFLTVFEAAAILRVSKQTVYRLVRAGDLEAVRVGGRLRIPAHVVEPRASASPRQGRHGTAWSARHFDYVMPLNDCNMKPVPRREASHRTRHLDLSTRPAG